MSQLEKKTAVVTGGTRGFGLAVAQALAQARANVVVCSRSQTAVAQAVDILKLSGAQAGGIACDVSDLDQVQALAEYAKSTFGGFDVWINNAGISPPYGPSIHVQPKDFVRTTQINVLGTYYGSLVAMRTFLARGEGKLINILGAGDRKPQPMQNAYASSKAWILNFTKALAEEYKDSGVGVFALNPGMMDTDLLLDVEVVQGYEKRLDALETVMRILSQQPDIPAQKAVWLASDETDGRTGLVMRELTTLKMVRGAMRELARRLLHRTGRPIDIHVKPVESAFPGKHN
jgi:glucose 1-dehydrogenase